MTPRELLLAAFHEALAMEPTPGPGPLAIAHTPSGAELLALAATGAALTPERLVEAIHAVDRVRGALHEDAFAADVMLPPDECWVCQESATAILAALAALAELPEATP